MKDEEERLLFFAKRRRKKEISKCEKERVSSLPLIVKGTRYGYNFKTS